MTSVLIKFKMFKTKPHTQKKQTKLNHIQKYG